jgi:hypothetical protein
MINILSFLVKGFNHALLKTATPIVQKYSHYYEDVLNFYIVVKCSNAYGVQRIRHKLDKRQFLSTFYNIPVSHCHNSYLFIPFTRNLSTPILCLLLRHLQNTSIRSLASIATNTMSCITIPATVNIQVTTVAEL